MYGTGPRQSKADDNDNSLNSAVRSRSIDSGFRIRTFHIITDPGPTLTKPREKKDKFDENDPSKKTSVVDPHKVDS